MPGFAGIPSNYSYLLKIRRAKKAKLKPCKYLKKSTVLRDYQVIGAVHLLSLVRMILGDGVGLGKCVSEDTDIFTNKGMRKLSDFLPDNPVPDNLYKYEGDLLLLTKDGIVKPDSIYYGGFQKGLRIKTQKGYELTGLSHHPIYAPCIDNLQFIRLDELCLDDYVCISRRGNFSDEYQKISYIRTSKYSKVYHLPDFLREDLAELLGFYVSEGHSPTECRLGITQHDIKNNRHIRFLLEDLFGYVQKRNNTDYDKEIKINSLEIYSLFSHIGVDMAAKSGEQIIPYMILRSPRTVCASFLRAYFEGDGSAEISNGLISCSSKSSVLIQQVQNLLLNFGIISRRKIKQVKVKGKRRPYHILYMSGWDTVLFKKEIGFISDRKNNLLNEIVNKKRNSNNDIIPIGKFILKKAVSDIVSHLRTLPEHKNFSVKGSGWKGIAGYHLKRMIEEVIYKKKKLTYELLKQFLNKIESNNLFHVVNNYKDLKYLYDQRFYFDKIIEIEEASTVFADFHVPKGQNFIGNGFVNHNTLQTITSFVYRLVTNPSLKLLVVTPKSAMEQWAEEFEKFCEGITVHILSNKYGKVKGKDQYGPIEKLKAKKIKYKTIRGFEARKAQYDTVNAHVLIVNYNPVQNDYRYLIKNRLPDYQVVFDEIQEIKNDKTKTWFGANEISEQAKYVYGLSATVIKNRLEEAYNIYKVVVPGLFPGKIKFYAEYTVRKKMVIWRQGKKRRFNKIVGYKNLNKFKELINPFFLIRKTREVASELPHLISRRIILEMSAKQDVLYKQALNGDLYRRLIKDKYFKFESYYNSLSDPSDKEDILFEKLKLKYEESLTKDGLVKNKIAALSYCQLVSNGPAWLGEEGESSKEKEFIRLFDQELMYEKTIVFTRFKSGIVRLQTYLDNLGIKHTRITGDEDGKARQKARLNFQDMDKDYRVIFITQAGSAAINLQAAGVILYYDTPWSYGDLYQSIGRAQRIGSIRDNIILLHMINKKTIDEHVLEILENKKDLINQVIGDIAEGAIEFKDDKILFGDDESSIDALFGSVFKKAS